MTIFRLKQLAASSAHAAAGAVRWNYDRAELIADGIVRERGESPALYEVLNILTPPFRRDAGGSVHGSGYERRRSGSRPDI